MASSKKSIVAAIAADAAIAVIKFLGAALTGSAVMVAEGIHSIVDGGNAALLLLGQKRAARPPSREHPFGHGREVYFWTSVVAMVAFLVGGGFAVIEGVLALHEKESSRFWINYIVLGAAFLFEFSSLAVAVRELKKYQRDKRYSGGLFAVIRKSRNPPRFVTVLEDTAAIGGLVIAALGVGLSHALRAPVIDAVASILDGVLLMTMAAILVWEAHSLLVGEGARAPLLADVERTLRADDHIAALDELHSLQLGPESVLLVVHARFAAGLRASELHGVGRALEARLRAQHPSIKHVLFDFD